MSIFGLETSLPEEGDNTWAKSQEAWEMAERYAKRLSETLFILLKNNAQFLIYYSQLPENFFAQQN